MSSLAVATATRRANRFIVVMDEAVMVVMKGRFGKPVLAIVEAINPRRAIPIMLYGVGPSGGRLDPACLFFACLLVSYDR